MPTARHQSIEEALARGFFVEVKRLRIKLLRVGFDCLGGKALGLAERTKNLSGLEVVEVEQRTIGFHLRSFYDGCGTPRGAARSRLNHVPAAMAAAFVQPKTASERPSARNNPCTPGSIFTAMNPPPAAIVTRSAAATNGQA